MSKENEVVIIHVPDAEPWCKYISELMGKRVRIKTLDLDQQEYENPPEVAMAIQEAYLVVILASPDMLTYMADKLWLSNSLCNVPEDTTVVVALCFVDSERFESTVRDTYKTAHTWKHYVIGKDQTVNISSVADMLDIVDKNEKSRPPKRPPKANKKTKEAKPCVIPSSVHAVRLTHLIYISSNSAHSNKRRV